MQMKSIETKPGTAMTPHAQAADGRGEATDRATLRALAMNAHVVDKAFLAAYHADLLGDSAQAADRFAAGVAGLKRLLRMAASDTPLGTEWGEDDERI